MKDVNLLPDVKVSSMAENRTRRMLILLVLLISVVWLAGLGGLYGFNQLNATKIKALEARKSADEAKIAELTDLGTNLIVLKQKLAGIKYIEDGRFNFPESLKYVLNVFPANVTPNKVSISDGGEVTMSLNSNDSNGAANFVSQMGQESVLKFPKLVSLHLSDEGKYSFVISAQYGKPTKLTTNN